MSKSVNILHLLLALSAAACIHFAWQETKDKIVKLDRLLRAPTAALVPALILMLIQLSTRQPIWPFMAAFFGGLAVGGTRGLTIPLKVERFWRVVRPPGMRAQVWIAVALAAAVVVDIAGASAGLPGLAWRFPSALAAMTCAGMLAGRAIAMGARAWRLVG